MEPSEWLACFVCLRICLSAQKLQTLVVFGEGNAVYPWWLLQFEGHT